MSNTLVPNATNLSRHISTSPSSPGAPGGESDQSDVNPEQISESNDGANVNQEPGKAGD